MTEHRLVVARDLSKTGGEEVGFRALEEAVTEDLASYSEEGRLSACLILGELVGKNLFGIDKDELRHRVDEMSTEQWEAIRNLEDLRVAAVNAHNAKILHEAGLRT